MKDKFVVKLQTSEVHSSLYLCNQSDFFLWKLKQYGNDYKPKMFLKELKQMAGWTMYERLTTQYRE